MDGCLASIRSLTCKASFSLLGFCHLDFAVFAEVFAVHIGKRIGPCSTVVAIPCQWSLLLLLFFGGVLALYQRLFLNGFKEIWHDSKHILAGNNTDEFAPIHDA